MRTPIQELLDYTTDLLHTFDSEERIAMAVFDYLKTNKKALLEKEKEVIEAAYIKGYTSEMNNPLESIHYADEAKLYYNETFNTK